MSAEHKRPLVAFVIVAIACMPSSRTSCAARPYGAALGTTGAQRVAARPARRSSHGRAAAAVVRPRPRRPPAPVTSRADPSGPERRVERSVRDRAPPAATPHPAAVGRARRRRPGAGPSAGGPSARSRRARPSGGQQADARRAALGRALQAISGHGATAGRRTGVTIGPAAPRHARPGHGTHRAAPAATATAPGGGPRRRTRRPGPRHGAPADPDAVTHGATGATATATTAVTAAATGTARGHRDHGHHGRTQPRARRRPARASAGDARPPASSGLDRQLGRRPATREDQVAGDLAGCAQVVGGRPRPRATSGLGAA